MIEPGRAQRVRAWVMAHSDARGVPVSVETVCAAAVTRLAITGAAMSVRAGLTASELVCATDLLSRVLEELQLTLGEGPSMDVLTGSWAIQVEDLGSAQPQVRWPMFAVQAVEAGGRGFFVFPIRVGAVGAGVLALCSRHPGLLPAEELAEAWVFAELALELLFDVQAGSNGRGDRLLADRLISGRPEVHQATGMISVQLGVGMTEALARLRARAFADSRPLSELAADVVARRLRFETENPG